MKRHSGFTLIELVVVIVILGLLSAFALPRFANLNNDARQARIEGAYGAVQSAANIVRMACEVDADCNPSEGPAGGGLGNAIEVEGRSITLAFGYPRRTEAGIARAAGIKDWDDGGDYRLTDATVSGAQNLRIRPDREVEPNQCEVLYREAASAEEPPEILLITDGC